MVEETAGLYVSRISWMVDLLEERQHHYIGFDLLQ
jgi:hypothetical protein